jgi:DNA-directed RNA polymerase specialized sigma subunit
LSKSQRIDLGLAIIAAVRRPGESLTLRDMAEICGCSKSAIWLIERAALKKLRRAIEREP